MQVVGKLHIRSGGSASTVKAWFCPSPLILLQSLPEHFHSHFHDLPRSASVFCIWCALCMLFSPQGTYFPQNAIKFLYMSQGTEGLSSSSRKGVASSFSIISSAAKVHPPLSGSLCWFVSPISLHCTYVWCLSAIKPPSYHKAVMCERVCLPMWKVHCVRIKTVLILPHILALNIVPSTQQVQQIAIKLINVTSCPPQGDPQGWPCTNHLTFLYPSFLVCNMMVIGCCGN